ncbi:MAG: KamA family radical SAM protein [Spirochaetaceae bacterium]|nr:KamA family radical SAM protein [Spirochaetaceae bacterium]
MQKQLTKLLSKHTEILINRLKDSDTIDAKQGLLAIERQLIPSQEENLIKDYELEDPLGAKCYQVTPRLVHQYKNRVLLLTTTHCFAFCRHCFRRSYVSTNDSWINEQEIDKVCEYISGHPEVQEILLSGGDPLTVSDETLINLIKKLRKSNSELLIRICTRAPIFMPSRINTNLLNQLASLGGIWFIPHINHPVEISNEFSPESRKAIIDIITSGIPLQSQTVLLKGVNDDVEVLTKLFQSLAFLGIKPGYLFQCDLAPGTSHFRVPLAQGIKIYTALRNNLSGLSTPVYALDLPGGGGKINLFHQSLLSYDYEIESKDSFYMFKKKDGSKWLYPKD